MKLSERIKKDIASPMPKMGAVLLIVVGVFIGTVFVFGIGYWQHSVAKNEAIYCEARYSSCREISGRNGSVKELILSFDGHEDLSVDGSVLSEPVLGQLRAMEPGALLRMYLHPTGHEVLELVCDGTTVINFDDAVENLSSEALGFKVLGVLLYFGAVLGTIKLIRKEVF